MSLLAATLRSARSHVLRLAPLIVVVALVAPAGASAAVQPMTADLGTGDLSQFSQWNATDGTLSVVKGGYGGLNAARASYSGGGGNGFARGIFNVNWQPGEDVWYGAAYYLPVGFHSTMQGQVALMRWDNWPSNPNSADQGGIVINGGDRRSYLMRDHQDATTGGWSQVEYAGPFDLPEGRWFWLEVHQHLSSGAGALSQVYVDGKLVVSSTTQNMFGRAIERIRYGLVAIAEGAQTNPLTLEFSRATVATGETGPLAGTVPAAGGGTTTVPVTGTSTGSRHSGGGKTTVKHTTRHSPRLRIAAFLARCVGNAKHHRTRSGRHHARTLCYQRARFEWARL